MSTSDKNLILADDIPAPLAHFQQEVIHPDNIALEFRMRRAAVLKTTQVWSLQWAHWRIGRKVNVAHWLADREEYRQLLNDMRDLSARAHQARDERNKAAYEELRTAYLRLADRRRSLANRLRLSAPLAQRALKIERTLDAWHLAQKHAAEERLTERQLLAEAKIYKQFILQEWAAREKCHVKILVGKQRTKKILPSFEYVDLTATQIWFQISTSVKGVVGYQRGLPGDVSISDILDDDVILNIQVACRRPVKKIILPHGAWIVIDRVGIVGGLPEYFTFERMMEFYPEFARHRFPLCLGVTDNARVVYLTLADYPHYLIAGWTGSGKSNIANVILATLILHHAPKDMRLILIDMKGGVEFGHLDGIPHLLCPVIDHISGVAVILSRLEKEMEERFVKLRARRAKHLEAYNERVSEADQLPRIAVFFDEVSVLAKQGESTRSILASLLALSSKGRAVGINLFTCTQHPSVDILPGPIKTNLTVRLAGRMPTGAASMTVLGSAAAAQLDKVKGRMLLMLGPDPKPIQTPFISDETIAAAVAHAHSYERPTYELPAEIVVHQEWTIHDVIRVSLKHLDGNVSTAPVFNELKQELSKKQCRELTEKIHEMGVVEHEGVTYQVVKRAKGAKYLEAIDVPVPALPIPVPALPEPEMA